MISVRIAALSVVLVCAAPLGCGGVQPTPPMQPDPRNEIDALIPQPVAPTPVYEVTDRVEVRTSMGTFVLGLYGKNAPRTVQNFLAYVDEGFYAGKIFHRVIAAFMIQGGGFDAELERAETREPIELEIIPGLKHEPGTVSMARTNDPHSATSQWFVCVAEARQLNGGYAAFGKVEEGWDVVLEISGVRTQRLDGPRGAMDDVPVTPVVIESVRRVE